MSEAGIAPSGAIIGGGAFDLGNRPAYEAWRARKLERYPASAAELVVPLARLGSPSAAEQAAIRSACARANMAVYVADPSLDEASTRAQLKAFGAAFGLIVAEDHRSGEHDGFVRIETVDGGGRLGYIPYTDRAIHWHTDGYYNFHGPQRAIKAMLLHCQSSAATGGVNRLLDPDIAYIRLRDEDPNLVAALMRDDAMAIPENAEPNGRVRPLNVGPVFYADPATGRLAMRYTARKRNIIWRDDATTLAAVRRLEAIVESDPLTLTVRMAAGQGLICNNVLHDRSGFVDETSRSKRLLLRVRYYNRIDE